MKSIIRVGIIIATFGLMVVSVKVLCTAIHLWSISDSVHYLESHSSWTEEDKVLYKEMQADRIAIKESSVIGALMVEAGSNYFSDLLRILSIIIALLSIPSILCLYFTMIQDAKRKYKKIKTGRAKRQYHKSLSKKFR